MIPQRDAVDRARAILADPATGPAIRARVAAWGPVTAEVREELARLLDGTETRRQSA
jgi:hypothetical protein